MTVPINVLITRDELMSLGRQVGGQPTAISPFSKVDSIDTTQRVPSAALVNAAGRIRADVLPAFNTLVSAQSLGLVAYSGENANFEASVYYSVQNATQPAALLLSNDGIKLQSPPQITNWVNMLGQFIGESIVKPVEFELELDNLETWILFGVIDTVRRQIMKGLAENNNSESFLLSVKEIAENQKDENLQWLSAYFAAANEFSEVNEAEILSSMQALAQKGLITFDNTQITPSEKLIEIAATFLTLEGHLRLQASTLDDENEIANTLIWGVQGRGNALLMWTPDENGVNIFSMSSAQAMIIIGSLLEAPASQFTDISLPKESTPQPVANIPAPTKNIPVAPPKKKRNTLKIVLVLGGIILICVCLAFFAYALAYGLI